MTGPAKPGPARNYQPMRILIHGINYAPELVGIGRYTGELGAWLASRGHAVTVLAGPPYYPEWRVAPAYRPQRWRREFLGGVEVLRAPLYAPARVTGRTRVLHELSFGASCLYWWLAELWRRPWDVVLAVCPLLQSAHPLPAGPAPGDSPHYSRPGPAAGCGPGVGDPAAAGLAGRGGSAGAFPV